MCIRDRRWYVCIYVIYFTLCADGCDSVFIYQHWRMKILEIWFEHRFQTSLEKYKNEYKKKIVDFFKNYSYVTRIIRNLKVIENLRLLPPNVLKLHCSCEKSLTSLKSSNFQVSEASEIWVDLSYNNYKKKKTNWETTSFSGWEFWIFLSEFFIEIWNIFFTRNWWFEGWCNLNKMNSRQHSNFIYFLKMLFLKPLC